jgi:UPF0755 protein
LSDDGWLGDSQEPGPAPGSAPYGQGTGRRGRGREPQPAPTQPGQYPQQQYPQQYPSDQQYSQDSYAANQYPQSYPAQPAPSYYEEPTARGGSPDRAAQQGQGYDDRQQYAPQPSAYTQETQAQSPYTGRRGAPQPQTPPPSRPQPARPASDPYASGSYGSGGSGSGSYSADPYASDSYASSDPYANDPYASSGGYNSQTQTRSGRDTSGGGYAPPARDGYAPGGYPGRDRDPRDLRDPRDQRPPRDQRQGSGTYPTAGGGYASGSPASSGAYTTDGYADPYATGGTGPGPDGSRRAPGGPQGRPQGPGSAPGQEPYGRRRAASPAQPAGYSPYEDDEDEYPSRPAPGGRRGSGPAPSGGGYGPEPDSRFESASAPAAPSRSRRRGGSDSEGDDGDEDRFNLIDEEDEEAGSGRGRKPKQKKGRNCLAVFVAFSVLAGGLGYGGYKAVQWYQGKYGAPPDYVSTVGTGAKVDVTIPSGSGGTTIGGLLFKAGIVQSQRAFTNACNANVKCADIQAGTYLLPKGISAAAAVTALLDPKNQDSKSQLITYGGERAGQIFAALETKTGWKDADIRAAIAGGKIDLPAWDTGQPGAKFPYAHIEGFIASETYVLTDYKTPTDLLKKMVDDQLAIFNEENLAAKAQALKLTEYKLLIIASLARAEAGTNTADLNKIAGVVFNRFDSTSFTHLGFDTSTLYGMGNTTTTPDNADKANPYNTSVNGIIGLPPSPIDNPDQQSIDAAINPNRANTYYYFCATADGVMYASNNTQWQNLGKKYPGLCGTR